MKQKKSHLAFIFSLIFLFVLPACNVRHSNTSASNRDGIIKLDNPVNVRYLERNLSKTTPRIILTPETEDELRNKVTNDPLVRNYYEAMKLNAEQILEQPVLERIQTGRRLLSVSRELLYRMNILGIVYLMEKDQRMVDKINEELIAVSNFSDWNPSHYLDVAEMALGVAIAIDWVGRYLPEATVDLALDALVEKGIQPSWEGNRGWISGTNNWNQVCNAGMIAASIAIAERDPELAASTISRSLDGIPYALNEYRPDGIYIEGPSYWRYGTQFSVVTSSMLTSSFGTDFGIAEYPGFRESAVFRALTYTPKGLYWNFADCGDSPGINGDLILAWFAADAGNPLFLEREKFMMPPQSMAKLDRTSGAGLVWLAQFEERDRSTLPLAWKGEGVNPLVVFRNGDDDPNGYYFGGKGGMANISHGHMDAGSFIFELDGVRWSVDMGMQNYHLVEETGFNLWGRCQECERWTLLSVNNFGHTTLTVNDELFLINGNADIISFNDGPQPEAAFDMTPVYGNNLNSALRRFVKEDSRSILIEDIIEMNENTESLTWQMMTTASVEILERGAMLRQDGKQLRLELLSHPGLTVSVISLDPPPFYLDKHIPGLKRIDIRIPAWISATGKETIRVRLNGN